MIAAGIAAAAGQGLGSLTSGGRASAEAAAPGTAVAQVTEDEAVEPSDDTAAEPGNGMGRGMGYGMGHGGFGGRAVDWQAVADTIGVELSDLQQRLRSGETLGDIAGDRSDEVAALLTSQINAHIDEEVAEGDITSDQAAAIKTRTDERVQAILDGTGGPMSGGKGHGMGHGGRGGHGTGTATPEPDPTNA